MALLKNSDTDLINLLPSSSKSKSSVITSNQEHDEDTNKSQKINAGPRLQNTGTVILSL